MMMRSAEEIMADPMASADEIASIALSSPAIAIMHVNCPDVIWWDLAAKFPLQALSSPSYPLMVLEAPNRWSELERTMISKWFDNYDMGQQFVPTEIRRAWATECVAKNLHAYEVFYGTPALQEYFDKFAGYTDKELGRGAALADELEVKLLMNRAQADVRRVPGSDQSACDQAEDAARSVVWLYRKLWFSAAVAAQYAVPQNEIKDEEIWQWHRLLQMMGLR